MIFYVTDNRNGGPSLSLCLQNKSSSFILAAITISYEFLFLVQVLLCSNMRFKAFLHSVCYTFRWWPVVAKIRKGEISCSGIKLAALDGLYYSFVWLLSWQCALSVHKCDPFYATPVICYCQYRFYSYDEYIWHIWFSPVLYSVRCLSKTS
jgi:hypothetical protein